MTGFFIRLYDRDGNPIGELSEAAGNLVSCVRTEEINGEHGMSVTTTRHMDVGTRALTLHADGRWREWVVDEPDETHDTGDHAVGTYHLSWSLQSDLKGICPEGKAEPGMSAPAGAREALAAVVAGSPMWGVGSTDVETRSGAVMVNDTSWDRLNAVVRRWGGEIDAEISVGDGGVTSRRLSLMRHIGGEDAARRFEWGHNLTSIRRTPEPGPYFCRVIPLGSGETEYAEDDVTTYEDKLTIAEVNGGVRYLSDPDAERAFRFSDGHGGYVYPTTYVSYSTDDADELIQMGREDLHSHTRPSVSYEGAVAQFSHAGMDVDGIRLGDEVQVVDYGFNEDAPLLIQERVIRMSIPEVGGDDAQLTIGRFAPTLERTIAGLTKAVGTDQVAYVAQPYDLGKYAYSVPTLPTYTVSKPDGGSYSVPTYDFGGYGLDGIGGQIADLESRVSAIDGGSYGGGGIDGWTHQIDGVTQETGTINFVTTGGSTPTPDPEPTQTGDMGGKHNVSLWDLANSQDTDPAGGGGGLSGGGGNGWGTGGGGGAF